MALARGARRGLPPDAAGATPPFFAGEEAGGESVRKAESEAVAQELSVGVAEGGLEIFEG